MSDQNKSNNGSNHGPNDGLNDADIKHLFDQQGSEPPQALDELILAAAKTTDKVSPETDKPKRYTQKYTAAFGLAAMVLLGVVIVPLMTKQPEYTLDATNTSNEESVATLFEQEKKLVVAEADEMTVTADFKAELADEPLQAKRALKSAEVQIESATARLASEPMASKSIPARQRELGSEVTPEERESPLKWIEAIKRLFEQNNLTQAKAELFRFRQKHPDSEHEALLPAALREQNGTD